MTKIQMKRGRKNKNTFGVENTFVKTWAKIDGEWIYIGMSKKQAAKVTSDGEYNYYTSLGKEFRQAK